MCVFGTSDEQTLDLIQYYYPNVITENYKYVQEVRCSLWDKKSDINRALGELRTEHASTDFDISIYDAYVYYCKRQRGLDELIVSKSYFEGHVAVEINAYILESGIISREWFR